MVYVNYITYLLCLNLSVLIAHSCIGQESKAQNIERKKMNDQKEVQKTISDWIVYINKLVISPSGQFGAVDSLDNQIILEWQKVNPLSSRLNEIIRSNNEMLAQTYAASELQRKNIQKL